jgi:hypothetical protein
MNSGVDDITPAATAMLAALAEARADWLDTAVTRLRSHPLAVAAWLFGSLGRGDADALSDIDLIVAVTQPPPSDVFAGLGLPGRRLFARPKPRNSPAGGAYLAVCLELADLPVLVDLYLWPSATAADPADGRLLFATGQPRRADLGFIALLDRHPTRDTRGSDPAAPETTLMLLQLAAKYLARSDHARLAGICAQLGIPAVSTGAVLRSRLADAVDTRARPDLAAAVIAAGRLIALADAVTHLPLAATKNNGRDPLGPIPSPAPAFPAERDRS